MNKKIDYLSLVLKLDLNETNLEFLVEQLNVFLQDNEDYKSILLASHLFSSQENINYIDNNLKKKLEDKTGYLSEKYDEKVFLNMLSRSYSKNNLFDNWLVLYKKVISCYIKYPNKKFTFILIAATFALSKKHTLINDHRLDVIKNLFQYLFLSGKDLEIKVASFFQAISKINFLDDIKKESYLEIALKEIILNSFEYDLKNLLVALTAFYSYCGNNELVNIFFDIFKNKNFDFEANYKKLLDFNLWPWYSKDNFEEKCKLLFDNEIIKPKSNNRSDFLSDASAFYLVPLIIYAQRKNNYEVVSQLLWHLSKKEGQNKLAKRFQELNGGFLINPSILTIDVKHRGSWLNNKLSWCKYLKYRQDVVFTEKEIQTLKELYTIRPFDPLVLSVMFAMENQTKDLELFRMFSFSIEKLQSHSLLGYLLIESINTTNQNSTRILLSRLNNLGFFNSILFSVEKVLQEIYGVSRKKINDKLSLVEYTLDFFGEVFYSENIRYNKACELYKKIKSQFKIPILKLEKPSVLTEKESKIFSLFINGEFSEILKLSCDPSNIFLVEIFLKIYLKKAMSFKVVTYYKMLSLLNKEIAILYNAEAELHFKIYNQTKVKSDYIYIASSNLWGLPAVLENPVDFKTKIFSENLFDISKSL